LCTAGYYGLSSSPHQFQQADHARENLIAQVEQFNEVLILEKETTTTKETKRKNYNNAKKIGHFLKTH